jgi:cysteine desulfurase
MSTQRRIYLDFNATAPLAPAARDAMVAAMASVGNPSSVHGEGRAMRDHVERARRQVADLTRRLREEIVFTSGGTEANWLGVMGLGAVAERRGLPKVVATTAIEHPSLRGPVDALVRRGWQAVPLDHDGPIGLAAFAVVNHELGTYEDATPRLAARGVLIHLDAVQAAGKVPLGGIGAHALAVSAHKLGGPQGVGALAIALDDGLPLVEGGHQERGRRPGTENTLGIIGFGAAAAAIEIANASRVEVLREQLEAGLAKIADVRIHGADRRRVGGTANAGFAGALGESIVMALDLAGIAVSTGAACTSGSIQPSPVLLGLGFTADQAREAVRFSLGPTTTGAEIEEVLRVLPGIVERARRHR